VLGGPAVDAWDRRKVMLVTQVLLVASCAGLAVNAMLGHPLLWPMFVCTAESAAFQSVDWAARRASLRRLVPPADLAAALSVQSAGFQATLVIGPAAAGVLIAHAGFAFVYWLNVASFGVAFIIVARLPALRPAGGGSGPGSPPSLAGCGTCGRAGRWRGRSSSTWGPWCSGCPVRCSRRSRRPCTTGAPPRSGTCTRRPGLGPWSAP
jgi:MFS family permease